MKQSSAEGRSGTHRCKRGPREYEPPSNMTSPSSSHTTSSACQSTASAAWSPLNAAALVARCTLLRLHSDKQGYLLLMRPCSHAFSMKFHAVQHPTPCCNGALAHAALREIHGCQSLA